MVTRHCSIKLFRSRENGIRFDSNARTCRFIYFSHTRYFSLNRDRVRWLNHRIIDSRFHTLFHNSVGKLAFELGKRETKIVSKDGRDGSLYSSRSPPTVAKSRDDRPDACRRSHSNRPPRRRKRSRSTASRHATKPNAAANRHYPRNNQRAGGGEGEGRQREGERHFSLFLRAAFPTFPLPPLSSPTFHRFRSRSCLSLVYLIIAHHFY